VDRRSFISIIGVAPLLRMPLWQVISSAAPAPMQEWGPPILNAVRAEHAAVVLSFTPVKGAQSYKIRYGPTHGLFTTIDDVRVTDYCLQGLENGTHYTFSAAAVGSAGETAASNSLSATPTVEMDWDSLATAFKGTNPTRSSCPFLIVHATESDDELREFMQVIYRFGFQGVTLHPYDLQGFLQENNWRSWRTIVDEARRLGLTVWEQDDKNYPCGYAGGAVVAKDRRFAKWEVTMPHQRVCSGPAALSIDMRDVLPRGQQLAGVSAIAPGGSFKDLSGFVSDHRLTWQIPEGNWEVFVHGAWQPGVDDPKAYPDLLHGEVRGYVDPLSEPAMDLYVSLVLEGTIRAVGVENLGRVWKGFYIDEPGFYSSGVMLGQAGAGYPWTPNFLARFEKRFGYALQPLLPLLWIERGSMTHRVRHDYMDFVSSEYARLFIGKQTQFAEAHGLQTNGHVREDFPYQLGPGTGSNFRTLEALSMGGFDHIFDQWYTPDMDVYWRQSKMASSISHYKQAPLDQAMVEHFAATGWRTGLTEMKAMIDWTTCRGLNHIVPCGFDTKTPPAWEVQPEFWLHKDNPLAGYFPEYQLMVNRETMMIRGGQHVAQALILDTAESSWVGSAEEVWKSCQALSQAHVDYDLVSYDVFSDADRCQFRDGRIHLGRETYQFLILPGVDAVPVKIMRRIAKFYEAGGTVFILGPSLRLGSDDPQFAIVNLVPCLPNRSADDVGDTEVKDLVQRLWGTGAGGPGHAYLMGYKDFSHHIYSSDVHDVWIDPNLTMLQFYHRRLSGRDLYFFNNEGESLRTRVRLRAAHGVPEIWNPVDGSIRQAACYFADDDAVSVEISLDRYESVFVVLNPQAAAEPHIIETDAEAVERLENGAIQFRKSGAGSVHYIIGRTQGGWEEKQWVTPSAELSPTALAGGWTRTPSEPNGAIYKRQFEWLGSKDQSADVIIEDMTQVIEVKLNEKSLGHRFVRPFKFDVGPALRPGVNEIEVHHIERYSFTSRLGTVRIAPYYEYRIT
jgi:hypothetical protein